MKRDEGSNESPDAKEGVFKKKKWALYAVIGGVVLGLLGAGYWWFFMRGRVSTDDAYVVADIASISSRIKGTVSAVFVDNGQFVDKGRILIELDPQDYHVAEDKARAVVAQMQADVDSAALRVPLLDDQTKSQVQGAEASLEAAKYQVEVRNNQLAQLQKEHLSADADLAYAQKEYKRYEELYKHRSVSQEDRDRSLKRFNNAKSGLEALNDQAKGSKASIKAFEQQVRQSEAALQVARSNRKKVDIEVRQLESLKARRDQSRAELKQARLNLSYCTIKAPLSGCVAQRNVQVGDRLSVGQPIMAVVPLQVAYVEANFKETQLTHVRVGQPATITADIYPSHTYHGRVVGIAAGSGAAFSLLPPENATGNWVKVVRRVPVRIYLNEPPPPRYLLRVGLSLEVTIDIGNADKVVPEKERKKQDPA